MSQLAFVEKKLDKKAKREVTKILRSYGNLEAIIKSMSVDMPKITTSYEGNETQRDNQFYSSTEDTAIQRIELEIKKAQLEKLNIIYKSISQEKKDIWNYRFIEGYNDEQTMIHMNMTSNRNKYFGEKYELMGMIADSFYLW
jgi:ArpU family phage transcriptional regulator